MRKGGRKKGRWGKMGGAMVGWEERAGSFFFQAEDSIRDVRT